MLIYFSILKLKEYIYIAQLASA